MKPCSRKLIVIAGAMLMCAGTAILAADPPKVGLVLAGGGARGLAHIGVIRYLEEQGIHVSAVAGTSMGSVIGGMYASGMNATQLEQVAREMDWAYAFNDATPRNQLSMRRKQEDFEFLIRTKFRFNGGKLEIPMGVVEGQHLNLMLHELVAPVAGIQNFDDLPIPFRAVATDIVSGEAVVIGTGDLALAMRASMSIPAIFVPVELDGKLLVDGGIANNIPVDVVHAMGVDQLIVIDVGTPLAERDQIGNVLGLMGQLTTIMTRKNSEYQISLMRPGDILISPDLNAAGVATLSFDKADVAIQQGYAAASALGSQLAALKNGPATTPPGRSQEPVPRIDSIRIETNSLVSTELLRSMVAQPIGAELDKPQLDRDLSEIYGIDLFSRVDYQVQPTATGNELVVRAEANKAGADFLKLGASWDQDSKGASEFSISASWREKGINRRGGEWYTFVKVGGNSEFGTEFYQPLDAQRRYFFDTNYRFAHKTLNLAQDGDIRARLLVTENIVEAAPGINLGNNTTLRGGAYVGYASTDIEIGAPEFSASDEQDGGYFAAFQFDTLDRPYFPGRGVRLVSRYVVSDEALGADTEYEAWSTAGSASYSIGENTVTLIGRWGEYDANDSNAEDESLTLASQVYTLGGFLNLSGYTQDSQAGNYMGFGALTAYRRVTGRSLLPVDLPVYIGASLEAGNTWLDRDDVAADDLIYAGSVYLGVDSPLGPLYLGVGVGEHQQYSLYLRLGQLLD